MIMRSHSSCVLLPLLLWGTSGLAATNFELDARPSLSNLPEKLEEVREEATVILPPWPRDADLLRFAPEGMETPYRFYIDGKNLRVDPSGSEVHYTLVIEAANGTRNVSYEGIRCDLRGSFKIFAYGNDGRFTRTTAPEWKPIPGLGSEAYRDDLHRYRFCIPRETRSRPLKDIQRALRGRASGNDAVGFQAQ